MRTRAQWSNILCAFWVFRRIEAGGSPHTCAPGREGSIERRRSALSPTRSAHSGWAPEGAVRMSIRRALIPGAVVAATLWTAPAQALSGPAIGPGILQPVPVSSRSLGAASVDGARAALSAARPATALLPGRAVRVPPPGQPPAGTLPSPPTVVLPTASGPSLPTDATTAGTSARSMHSGATARASNKGGSVPPTASAERGRATIAPTVQSEGADARPMGVSGAYSARSNAHPSFPLGTATTKLALWAVLCALALVARSIVISAWRDARRRQRAFSPGSVSPAREACRQAS